MSFNKRILSAGAATLVPSEHFGVVLYEGDGTTSRSVKGGKFGPGVYMRNPSSSSQYIALPKEIINGTSGNISVSFWMNTTYSSAQMFILTTDITPYYSKIAINTETNGKLRLSYGNASNSENNFYTSSTNLLNGSWHHIAYTLDIANTTAKVYVNGSLETTHSTTITPALVASPTLTIGNVYRSDTSAYQTNSFKGKLDQFRFFHKILSASEVTTLYQESATTVTSLTPLGNETEDTLQVLGDSSCIAHYKFENDETDASGTSHGTGTSIQYAAGRFGQAANFNATNSVITGTAQNVGSSFSISAWIYPASYGEHNYFNLWVDSSNLFQIGLSDSTNEKLKIAAKSSNTWDVYTTTASPIASINQWYHIVVNRSSSDLKIYVNGTFLESADNFYSKTYNTFNIGSGKSTSNNSFFDGKIDQLRVFNKTLSASEVTTLYEENSLVASYRFEGNVEDDRRTYNGTASNVSYDYALGFTPDLVWTKRRNEGADHNITDSTRGVQKGLNINTNAVEGAQAPYGVKSFDSGGFTVSDNAGGGASVNGEDDDYVAWCWRANGGTTSSNTDGSGTSTVQVNTDAGFSIAKMTFAGAGSIGHGLGVAPDLVILKGLTAAEDWQIYHSDIGTGKYLSMSRNSGTDATTTRADSFSAVSSTIVTNNWTGSSVAWIMYSFVSIDGFSKFGSYTGNGSANGPIVETGFEPAFIMFKRTDGTSGWNIQDNRRNTINPRTGVMQAHNGDQEYTSSSYAIDFLSNGFKIQTSDNGWNTSSGTYIYMAFAADPDEEVPTLAKSFDIKAYTGNQSTNSITGVGFKPDLIWLKERSGTDRHVLFDVFRGDDSQLTPDSNAAVTTYASNLNSFDTDGFTLGDATETNGNNETYVAWTWKANDNVATIEEVTEDADAIAIYKFEDNANDVTGDHNGTASGVSYVSGKFNKAASFDNNANTKITIGTLSSVIPNNTTGVSFSFWVYLDSVDTGSNYDHWFIGQEDYGGAFGDGEFSVRLYEGKVYTDYAQSSTIYRQRKASTVLSTGQWYHIVATYDTSNANITEVYLNGVLETSSNVTSGGTFTTTALMQNSSNMTIGGGGAGTDGEIDQFRIYDKVLNAASVTNLYNETVAQNSTLNIGTKQSNSAQSIVSVNANAGFSIVEYTATGTTMTVPHGLSAAPTMIIAKTTNQSYDWLVYHASLGATKQMVLNDNRAEQTTTFMANTAPTATVFTAGSGNNLNYADGNEIIAYCFHDVTGYSKFGSYSGSSSAVTVTTGFQPDFVIIKRTNTAEEWNIIDSVRGGDRRLKADTTAAEVDESSDYVTFAATSFTVTVTGNASLNNNGDTFIYAAFKIN